MMSVVRIMFENSTREGNAAENGENEYKQNHPSNKVEIVQENSSRIYSDERNCEQDKIQKETHDNDEPGENETNHISEDLNDQLNVKDSTSDSGKQFLFRCFIFMKPKKYKIS